MSETTIVDGQETPVDRGEDGDESGALVGDDPADDDAGDGAADDDPGAA